MSQKSHRVTKVCKIHQFQNIRHWHFEWENGIFGRWYFSGSWKPIFMTKSANHCWNLAKNLKRTGATKKAGLCIYGATVFEKFLIFFLVLRWRGPMMQIQRLTFRRWKWTKNILSRRANIFVRSANNFWGYEKNYFRLFERFFLSNKFTNTHFQLINYSMWFMLVVHKFIYTINSTEIYYTEWPYSDY